MPGPYFTHTNQFIPGTNARGDDVDSRMQALVVSFDLVDTDVKRAIKMPVSVTTDQILPETAARINRFIGFDGVGDLIVGTPTSITSPAITASDAFKIIRVNSAATAFEFPTDITFTATVFNLTHEIANTNTIDADSTGLVGSIHTDGGIGAVKSIESAANVNAALSMSVGTTLSVGGLSTFSSTIRTDIETGSDNTHWNLRDDVGTSVAVIGIKGTTGDLFIGSNTTQDIIVIDRSTNRVGILTNTPAETLDVNGTFKVSGNATINGGAVDSTSAFTFTPGAGLNLNIALSTTGDFVVNTDDLFVDTSTGNVGINDSSPSFRLAVGGTFNVTGAATIGGTLGVTGIATFNNTINANGGAINSTSSITITPNAGSNLDIVLSTTGDFVVNTDDLFVDTSTGFTAFGHTSPQQLVHIKVNDVTLAPHAAANFVIEDTGTNYAQFLSGVTDTAGWLFGDTDANDSGRVVYDHNIDTLQFNSAGALSLALDENNHAGFRILNPAKNVQIHQPDSGESLLMFSNTTTGTTAGNGLFIGIDASEQANFLNAENTASLFWTNNTIRWVIGPAGTWYAQGLSDLGIQGAINATEFYCNGARNTRTVILTAPEAITLSVLASWTLVSNTTLGTAGAIAALLKVNIEASADSTATSGSTDVDVYLRETGSGLAFNDATRVASAIAQTSVVGQLVTDVDEGFTIVSLDGSQDFDYYWTRFTTGGGGTSTTSLHLVGYIVEC